MSHVNGRNLAVIGASWFILALLQLVGPLIAAEASIPCAVAVGIACCLAYRAFHVTAESWWSPAILSVVASAAGIAVFVIGTQHEADPSIWLSPALAGITAAVPGLVSRGGPACALCNRRLRGVLSFVCPRCGLRVCEWGCWEFDHARCRLCLENHVPVLPSESRWWENQLGARIKMGKCLLCLTVAATADLRECRLCHRTQCRSCWDFANGTCSHCHWVIPDLPPQLGDYIVSEDGAGGAPPDAAERPLRRG